MTRPAPTAEAPYLAAYAQEVGQILHQAKATVAGWPPLLSKRASQFTSSMLHARFTRIAAILPFWMGEMLENASPGVNHSLGLANVWGWWYYRIQDWVIDGENGDSAALLEGMAFYQEHLRLLRHVIPGDPLFWSAWRDIVLTASEANARELEHRFGHLGEISAEMIETSPPEGLADRAAPLRLSTIAQLRRLGYLPSDGIYQDMLRIIHAYSVVNQLVDDEEDLVRDLSAGRLTFVSSAALQRMVADGAISGFGQLTVDRIVGYFITDEALLSEIHEIKRHYVGSALALAQNYGGKAMGCFLWDMLEKIEHDYARHRRHRRAFRGILGLNGTR